MSSTRRVSDEFAVSQFSKVRHLDDLSKNIQSCQIVHHIPKNIAKRLIHPSIYLFDFFKNPRLFLSALNC